MYRGFLRYFPNAVAAIAQLSQIASDQHGHEHMHWDHAKSKDQTDAEARHMLELAMAENGEIDFRDEDGTHFLVKKAWRALADCERAHLAGTNIFAKTPLQEKYIEHSDNDNVRFTGEGESADRPFAFHPDNHCLACDGTGWDDYASSAGQPQPCPCCDGHGHFDY